MAHLTSEGIELVNQQTNSELELIEIDSRRARQAGEII